MKQLADLQGEGKIYLDEAFQSNARWGTIQKQGYLQSVIEGRATSAITIARISDLVSSLKDNYQTEKEDYKAFCELMLQGYEYITIDGNKVLFVHSHKNCVKVDTYLPEIRIPLPKPEFMK